MKKTKGKVAKTSFVLILMLGIIAVYFITSYVKNKNATETEEKSVASTETEKLLQKDLNINYPASPREVVKLYNRIIKCLYNEKPSDEEINQLGRKARFLFDQELLDNKTEEKYLEDLKKEVEDYRKKNRTIVSYELQKSSEIELQKIEGKEYASISSSYFVKEGSGYQWVYHKFLVRKDEAGEWKIVGWKITPEFERDEED